MNQIARNKAFNEIDYFEQKLKESKFRDKKQAYDKEKVVNQMLNKLRRRNINVKNHTNLTEDNLKQIKAPGQQNDQTIQADQSLEKLNIANLIQEIRQEEVNIIKCKCVLCEATLNEFEQNVSKKLADFIVERNDKKRVVSRIKQKLQQKLDQGESLNVEIETVNEENDLPQICFKCHYDLILVKEGRHKAIQLFHHAANTEVPPLTDQSTEKIQQNQKRIPYIDSPMIKRSLKAHLDSEEMKESGFLKGTFFDYKRKSDGNKSRNQYHNPQQTYQSVLLNLRMKQTYDVQGMVNINREQNLEYDESQIQQSKSVMKRPRKWVEGFSEKIVKSYGNDVTDERQEKILEKLEQDRMKYNTGQRILDENRETIREAQEQSSLNKRSKLLSTPLSKDRFSQKTPISVKNTMNRTFNMSSISHEAHNQNIYYQIRPVDKTFFRKLSSYAAYANAQFNGGVFINPYSQDA